jgi:predicted NBD/HSP70 family sugar kinase
MTLPAGPGDVLALIRRGNVTRSKIGEITGLSRVTVAQRVDALLSAGLIREAGVGQSTGGRRPAELQFDHEHAILLLASIDTMHTRIAAVDLAGNILGENEIGVSILDGPGGVLDTIGKAQQELITTAGLDGRAIAGLGVSLPAPVDPHTSRPSEPPMMPGWDGYPVGEHLSAIFAVPTVVENDANVMALGERTREHPDSTSLCLVKVSTGIGSGLVVNGSIYAGSDGGAGDIGHVRTVGHDDALCQCGSRGCLAAVAGGRAVAHQLTEAGIPAASGRDVRDLLSAGDPTAVRLTRQAGREIGAVVATLVCILNPAVLVISGDLASNPLLSGIRETLYPRTLPRATRNLEVRLGRHGQAASFAGLTRLIVDNVFDPNTVNQRMQA